MYHLKFITINLFYQVVYKYKRHIVVVDYTGQCPNYDVFDLNGKWIGCTNAVSEESWKGNCRCIIDHVTL